MYPRIRTRNQAPVAALVTGSVEKGILPLVEALNATGRCRTIASCQGHGDIWGASWVHVPYVLFYADMIFARALQHQMDPGYLGVTQGTRYGWSLSARFHPDEDNLAWTLTTRSLRLPEFWTRRHLDADVRTITEMARRASGLPT